MAAVLALLAGSGAQAVAPGPEPLPPFTGLIKNHTKAELSVYSQNSLGTLIIPANGWIEYVVWDKNFDLLVYLDGKPYFAQKMVVTPGAYTYMTKKYDFIAEIKPPTPKVIKKPVKKPKKYRKPKGKKKAAPC